MYKSKNVLNNLIKAAVVSVADQLGFKKYEGRKKNDPLWKRHIEENNKAVEKGYQHSRKGKERTNWCTQRG